MSTAIPSVRGTKQLRALIILPRSTTLRTVIWMMGASSSVATRHVKDLVLPHEIKYLRA